MDMFFILHASSFNTRQSLGTLATDSQGQLDVLGHDGHALRVYGAQVCVLKQSHQKSLHCEKKLRL
jgi:hypothetical protein